MGLVPMEFRKSPERPSNLHGRDDGVRPHDERAAEAWTLEAREAVARKLILGCNVTSQELEDARLTMEEARALAVDIERGIESNYHRLVNPPEPKEVQPSTNWLTPTYVPDPEPEQPAPKRRRKKRDTSKMLMRKAIERKKDEDGLFR